MIVPTGGADDPRLVPYRHVGDHHWLSAHGLFVAEGRLVVQRLIAAGSFRIDSVLVSPAALDALHGALAAIAAPVYVLPQPHLNQIAGFDFHRGCLALAARPEQGSLDSIRDAHLLLGLEAIGNPDNVGGLFRTGAAFGVHAVLVDSATGDPLYRKALRTSMGAVLQLPFVGVSDWLDAVAMLRSSDFRVVALTPGVSAMPLDEFMARRPVSRWLVMVGAEGQGLSARLLETADYRVRIPMAENIDSLNVTVAAGVMLSRLVSGR